MGNDDLRALVAAVSKALDREREDRIRDRTEDQERMRRLEESSTAITRQIIRYGAIFATVIGVLAWFGPTRLSALLKALFGGP